MNVKIAYRASRNGLESLLGHAERHPKISTAALIEHAVDEGWLTTYVLEPASAKEKVDR